MSLLLALGVALLLRRHYPDPPLPYRQQRMHAARGSRSSNKFDEYADILGERNAPGHLAQQQLPATFQLLERLKAPPAKVQRSSRKRKPAAAPAFHSYQAKGLSAREKPKTFLPARVEGSVQVQSGDSLMVVLEEGTAALPSGTRLFGIVRLSGRRLEVHFTAAEHGGKRWLLSACGYDQDLQPGLQHEASAAWQAPVEDLAQEALSAILPSDRISKSTQQALQAWRTAPVVQLEEGRVLYVKLTPTKEKQTLR
ncbi:MAG: conjugative transposon protein TraM [Bacteroidota bacterium]